MGIPHMVDHRYFPLLRQTQLVQKPAVLLQPVLILPFIMVVKARFADGHHALGSGQLRQLLPIRPSLMDGTGGMDTDGRKQPAGVAGAQLEDLRIGRQVSPPAPRSSGSRMPP